MSAFNFDALYTPAFNTTNHSNPGDYLPAVAINGQSLAHNASVEVQNFAGPINSLVDAANPSATYFELTLTPAAGLQLSATAFELGSRSETGVGPTTLTLVGSTDGFASNFTQLGTMSLTANSTWSLYSMSVSYSAPIDTPVTFRIYGTDGVGGSALPNWRIDDVTFSVVAVPEPSTYATLFIGVVLLGAQALRRRKFAVA